MDALPARLRLIVVSLILICAALAAYWNSFSVPFLLDDTMSIVENPSIRQLFPLGPVLSPPADAGVGGRPVANLSYAFNYAVSGLGVRSYHITNLAIHVIAGLALFGVVRRTLSLENAPARMPPAASDALALAIACLWLVHPLQTESVTYLSQRTESLMATFYLLTLYAFIRGAEQGSTAWYGFAVVTCTLGMATKEVMVTAPVVLLLYDRIFLAGSFREIWVRRRKIHLALAATWLVLLVLLRDVHERGVGYEAVTWWQYVLTECRAIVLYLRLALWPAPLVFDYGTGVARTFGEVWPEALLLVGLLLVTVWAVWRRPKIGFALAAVFILIAPTSSVVPVAGQPIAEHRMYLPLALVVSLFVLATHRWLRGATFMTLLPVAILLGYLTHRRNADYQTAVELWTDTVEKRPQNARAHAALGAARLEKRDVTGAIAALENSLRLDPRGADAHNNLATALQDANRPQDAIRHFEASLKLRPGVPSTHYNFGNALLSLGRTAEAIAQQQQALILRPEFPEAAAALGNALCAAGRHGEGIARYREALQVRPDLVAAHYALANVLTQLGRGHEAIPHYEATLRAVPGSIDARYNFGNLLFDAGRYAEAAEHFAVAVRLKPDFVEAHNNLANAYAMSGRTTDAIAHYETALQLRPDLAAARTNLETLRKKAGDAPKR